MSVSHRGATARDDGILLKDMSSGGVVGTMVAGVDGWYHKRAPRRELNRGALGCEATRCSGYGHGPCKWTDLRMRARIGPEMLASGGDPCSVVTYRLH